MERLCNKFRGQWIAKAIVYTLGLALQRGQETIWRISHLPEKNKFNLFQAITWNKVKDFTKFKISLDSKGYYYSTSFFEHFSVLEERGRSLYEFQQTTAELWSVGKSSFLWALSVLISGLLSLETNYGSKVMNNL